MADAPQIPDETEVRARWGAFAWTAENAEKANAIDPNMFSPAIRRALTP